MRTFLTWTVLAAAALAACGSVSDVGPASAPSNAGSTSAGGAGLAAGDTNSAGLAGNRCSGVLPQGGNSGQSGAGGAAGRETGGSGGGPLIDARFKLVWRDDFDSFDDARWSKQTHTFDENLAHFAASNVVVEGGLLKLRVTKAPSADREYAAAEVATKETFTYGRFAGRIRFCAGSGMVSSLFTYQQDVAVSWQEMDIEYLGKLTNPNRVQYNLISGTAANRVYQPKVVAAPGSATEEFHDYALEWAPEGITFFIDGVQTWKDVQPKIKDAQTLHMNAWPANDAVTQFAGAFDAGSVPCEAQYDWVEAYRYSP
ncbi:MAG: glycosyl hydrolase family protein [Myxococcales bacterium]|nr:MAG: glycosyl hydrolase family protein [Myxococcales bacterium]